MTLKTALCLSYMFSIALLAAPTQCGNIYYGNNAPDILNSKLTLKTKELCYSEFTVMHSGISRTPLWSAEHLTREQLRSKSERTNDFHPEERIPSGDRAELDDYSRSGYDRGHMAPSADMPNEQAQHESFSLANMIPQVPENNRGIWSSIEATTRHLTNQKGQLYIITGPLFVGNDLKRIGGRVLVPTKIYKAIYDPASDKGAAYLVDNAEGDSYRVISISELEKISGIRHFPKMSTSAKQTPMALPEPRSRNSANSNRSSSYAPPKSASAPVAQASQQCEGKKTCKEMSSCAEARFYLTQCGVSRLDGDGDGMPCEKLCR
ncbi:MAG: DNA/RNA non-specific endonuclease [Sulfuricurvum sp.]|jgi:endonuclease G